MKKQYLPLFGILFLLLGISPSLWSQLPGSGNSLDFGGTRYVNVANHASLNPTTSITIEAWIKADSWQTLSWQGTIVSKDGWASGEQGYTLRCGANGTLSFNLGRGPNWEELLSTPQMQTNQWYHVAATWDGSVQRLFINGNQVASRNFSGTISQGTYDMRIGAMTYTAGGIRDFDGQIDEVRIWNKAITPTNIRTWMCQRLNATHPQDTSLVAYYRFDETGGTTATDNSGNGRTGTLIGAPTRQTSGAALGDVSSYSYTTPLRTKLIGPNNDSIVVNNISGSPSGVHLYFVGQKANVTTPPASITILDTTQYIGIFLVGGTNARASMTYYYQGNPLIPASVACKIKLAHRTNNAGTSWTASNANLNLNAKTLGVTAQPAREYILGFGSGLRVNNLGPARFCEGDTTALQVSGANTSSYQWLRNGLAISGATDSIYHVLQAGSYTATISTAGCNDTSTSISIAVDPAPVLSMSFPSSVCEEDGFIPLTGSPIGGTFSGTWITGGNFRAQDAGAGVHSFNYSYTDSIGCSATLTDSITVLPSPVVTFNASQNIFCQSDAAITLTGGSPAGGSFSGPGVSNGMFDPGIAAVGNHNIVYTYTNASGCSQTANQNIQVLGAPNVSFAALAPVCIDRASYQLTSGSPAGGYYKGNGVRTISFFDPMVAGLGSHQLTYVYTNAAGCTDSASQILVVNALPVVTMAPFDTFCADYGPITLNNGMPAGGVYSGPAVTNGVFNLSIQGTFPISYAYTDPLTGCTNYANQNLRLFPVPKKPTVTPVLATLISSASSGNQWYNSADVLIPWATNDTFVARANGTYYVIVTNEFGCVSPPSDPYDINNVGIETDLSLGQLGVFPNPNKGRFFVQFGEIHQEKYHITIDNLLGQRLFEESFSPNSLNAGKMEIEFPDKSPGLYLLTVESKLGRMSWKILVE